MTTPTPSELQAIRERCEDVRARQNRTGVCSAGEPLYVKECRKCGASSRQNCPQDLKDGDDAMTDRAALLAACEARDAIAAEDTKHIVQLIEAVNIILGTPGFIRGREKASELINAILTVRAARRATLSAKGDENG